MLRNLTASSKRTGDASSSASLNAPISNRSSSSVADSGTVYVDERPDDEGFHEQIFEGSSSMAAHAEFASDVLHHAVESGSIGQPVTPDMHNALVSLQRMVHMRDQKSTLHETTFANRKPMPKGGFHQLKMPPSDAVLKLLREIKGECGPDPQTALFEGTGAVITEKTDLCSGTPFGLCGQLFFHHS